MNKIFKVIWSKTKQCYIVVSEIAKNKTGKKKTVVAAVFAALALVGGGQDALGAAIGSGSGNSFSNAQAGVSFVNGQGLAIGSNTTIADGNTNTVAVGIASVARGSSSVSIGGGRSGTNAAYRTKGGQIAIGWTEVNGEGAVGIGGSSNTTVTGDGSVGIGGLNSVNGTNSIGMATSTVNGNNSVALASASATGTNSFAASGGIANGDRSLAIGQGADTKGGAPTSNPGGTDNIALGTNAITNATNYNSNNIAIGSNTKANGGDSVAIGRDTVAASWRAYASGINAYAGSQAGVAIGAEAKDNYATHGGNQEATITNSYAGVAIGARTVTEGTGATAIGFNAQATKRGAIAIGGADDVTQGTSTPNGTAPQATAERAIAIGTNAQSLGAASIAMGYNSSITNGTQNSLALGTSATSSASNSVAIGNMASVSVDSGVAIGRSSSATQGPGAGWGGNSNNRYSGLANGALTSQFGGVSIGKVDNGYQWTRKLHGLAAGSADTDAVNVAQLKNTQLVVSGNTGSYGLRVFDQSLGIKSANTNVLTTSMSTDGSSTLTLTPVMGTVTTGNNNLVTGGQVYQAIQDNKTKYVSIGGVNNTTSSTLNINNDGATTANAIAIGPAARATGASALSLGAGAQSRANGTIAIGGYDQNINAQANGNYAVSVGANSIAGGSGAIAIGSGSGSNWGVQGGGAKAAGDNTVAIGGSSNATQAGGIAIGSAANGDPTKGPQSTGKNAIAIGESAAASGVSSLAILSSNASGKNSIAIGTGANAAADSAVSILGNATGINSTSVGTSSYATGKNASAFGGNARATKDNSTALGINGYATAVGATAINGQASGEYSQSYGISSQAGGKGAIAIGSASDGNLSNGPQAFGDTSIAIGALAKASKVNSIAFLESQASGINSISFGAQTKATADNAVAIGYDAQATYKDAFAVFGTASNTNAVAIGRNSQALSDSTTAIGAGSLARGNGSVGIGGGQAQTAGTVSIGTGSNAQLVNAVAIGSNSVANRDSNISGYDMSTNAASTSTSSAWKSGYAAVSVGTSTNTRQIINVAAGSQDTDAVNVAQLKQVSLKVKGDDNVTGTTRLSDGTLNIKGATNSGITTTVSGSTVNIGLDSSKLAWNLKAGTGATNAIGPGNTVTVRAGKNMQISQTVSSGNPTITVATSDNPTFTNITANNLMASGIVQGTNGLFTNLNAGNANITQNITLGGTLTAGGVTVSSNGINAGSQNITGVADGVAQNDAVNKGQLDAVDTTATTAARNAQNAVTQANSAAQAAAAANTAATNAQNTANAANQTAQTAQNTANAANTTANRAETAVTNLSNTVADMRFDVSTGSDGNITRLTTADNTNHPTLSLKGETGYLDVKTGTNGTNEAVVNISLAQDLKDKINNAGKFKVKANGDAGDDVVGGDTIDFNNGDNIDITRNGKAFTIGTKQDVTFNSASIGGNTTINNTGINTNRVAAGNTVIDNAGLTTGSTVITGTSITADKFTTGNIDIDSATNTISGLSDATDDDQAVNKGQLDRAVNTLGTNTFTLKADSSDTSPQVLNRANGLSFKIAGDGDLISTKAVGNTVSVNATQALKDAVNNANNAANKDLSNLSQTGENKIKSLAGAASKFNVKANANAEAEVAGGDTITFNDGDNIEITQTGKDFTIGTKANATFTSVTTGNSVMDTNGFRNGTTNITGTGVTADTFSAGNTTIDTNGLITGTTIIDGSSVQTDQVNVGPVELNANGINAGNTVITNVASGAAADTNAANIGDVKNIVNNSLANVSGTLNLTDGANNGSVDLKTQTLTVNGTGAATATVNGQTVTVNVAEGTLATAGDTVTGTAGVAKATDVAAAINAANRSQVLRVTDGNLNTDVINLATEDLIIQGDGYINAEVSGGHNTLNLSVSQTVKDAITNANNAANKDLSNLSQTGEDKIKSLAGEASKFKVKANSDAGDDVSGGDSVNFIDGDNIAITRNGKDFTIGTKPNVTFTSVTTGNSVMDTAGFRNGTTNITGTGVTADTFTAGNTVINTAGVTADKFTSGGVSIDANGINAGGKNISNVANATTADQAINKGQLDTAINNLTNNIGTATNISYKANGGTTETTTLANGFDFTNGNLTTTEVAANGVVKVNVTQGTLTTTGGTVAGTTGVATAPEVAAAINSAVTDAKTGLQTQITQNATDIGTNKTAIATNTANITKNAGDIATNATAIAKNAGDIATNTTAITKNTGDIATLNTTVANNNTAVNNRIDGLTLNTSGNNGTGSVNLKNDTLAITGTNGITTTATGSGITIALDTNNQGKLNAITNTIGISGNTGSVTAKSLTDGSINFKVVGDGDLLTTTATGDTVTVTSTAKLNDAVTAATNAANKDLGNLTPTGEAKIKSLAGEASKFKVKANGDAGEDVTGGDAVDFINGDNIEITRNGRNFTIGTAKDVTFDSVTTGNSVMDTNGFRNGSTNITGTGVTADTFTAGNTTINTTGLTNGNTSITSAGVAADKFTAGNVVVNGATNKISGLADATANDEAINKGQLDTAINNINQNANKLASNTFTLKADATDTTAQRLDNNGGLAFKVAGDGDLISTTAAGDTVTVGITKGTIGNDTDGKAQATAAGVATTTEVATAINTAVQNAASTSTLKIGGDTAATGSVNLKNDTLSVKGDNKFISTAANGNDITLTVDEQAIKDAAKSASTFKVKANANNEEEVKGGDTITYNNGDNIEITQTGKTFTIGTAANVNFTKVTTGNSVMDTNGFRNGSTNITGTGVTADTFTAGNTTINTTGLTNGNTAITSAGVTADSANIGGTVTINNAGINAGNTAITNVATGGTTRTNAANIGDVQDAVANLSQNLKVTDGTNTGTVDLKNQSLKFSGTNGVTTSVNGQEVTIGLDTTNQGKINAISNTIGITGNNGSVTAKSLTDGSINFKVVGDGDLVSTTAAGDTVTVNVTKGVLTNDTDGTVKATTAGAATAGDVATVINQAITKATGDVNLKTSGNTGTGTVNLKNDTLAIDGDNTLISTTANANGITVNATKALTDAVDNANNAANKDLSNISTAGQTVIKNLAGDASKFKVKANTDTGEDVVGGSVIDFKNGDNIEITRTGLDFKISTAKNVTFDSATIGGTTTINNAGITTNKVVAGNTTVDTNGLTNGNTTVSGTGVTADKFTAGGITIDKTAGIDAGGKPISNVANATTADQAINKGQFDTAINDINNKANTLGQNTIKLGAENNTATGTQQLNKAGGVQFNVVGDNDLITTSAAGDAVTVSLTKGSLTNNADGTVNAATAGAATTGDVATVINTAITKATGDVNLKTSGNTGTGTVNLKNDTLAIDGDNTLISTTANANGITVNATKALTDAVNNANNAANKDLSNISTAGQTVIKNLASDAATFKVKANGDTGEDVKGGDAIDFINGDNIEITRNGRNFTIGTAANVSFTKVTTGNSVMDTNGFRNGSTNITGTGVTADTFTAGNTTINTTGLTNGNTAITSAGVTADSANIGGTVTINNAGINAGNTAITNVATGGTTRTNAANIGDVQDAVANLSQNLTITDGTTDGVVDLKNQKLNVTGTGAAKATVAGQTVTINVAEGTLSTDAAGQVNGTTGVAKAGDVATVINQAITKATGDVNLNTSGDTGTGSVNLKTGTLAVTGDTLVSTNATGAGISVTATKALKDAVDNANNAANKDLNNITPAGENVIKNLAGQASKFKVKANTDTGEDVVGGSVIDFKNGDNIEITRNGLDFTIGTARNVNFDSATIGGTTTINNNGITTNKVVAGNTSLDNSGVTADKVTVGPVSIDKTNGIDAGNTVISNIANGTGAKDAINKGQLDDAVKNITDNANKLASNTFTLKADATDTTAQRLDNNGGLAFKVAGDNDLISTTAAGDTVTVNLAKGSLTNNADGTANATKAGVATTGDVANVINQAITKATDNVVLNTEGNTGTGSVNLKTQTLKVEGTGGITVTAANQGFTVALDPTSNKNVKAVENTISIGGDTGSVTAKSLVDGNIKFNIKGDNNVIKTTGAGSDVTINFDAAEAAKSVNLTFRENGGTVQTRSLNDGFNFKNGNLTTASAAANGDITFNVVEGTVTVDNTGKATAGTTPGVATAKTVADTVNAATKALADNTKTITDGLANRDLNNLTTAGETKVKDLAAFNVTASGNGTGHGTETIKGGNTVTFNAGQNIVIDQAGGTFTVKTSDDVTFNKATIGGNTTIDNAGVNTNKATIGGNTTIDNTGVNTNQLTAGNSKMDNTGFTNGNTSVTGAGVTTDRVTVGPVTIDKNSGIDAGNTKITGVAAGVANTDAVNVGQLNKTVDDKIDANNTVIDNKIANATDTKNIRLNYSANGGTDESVSLADGLDFQNGHLTTTEVAPNGVVKVNVVEGKIDVDNKGKASATTPGVATAGDVAKAINDLNQNVKDARIRFNADNSVANDATTSIDTGLNQTIEFIGGADKSKLSDNNIGVNVVGNKMEIKLAKEITGLTSTSYTDGAANPNTTVVNAGGITIQAAPFTPTGSTTPVTPPPVSLTAAGLDNGGNTITNVAPGQNDTDAVNVAQLKAFGGDTSSALQRLGRENQRVGAQAAAMAALKPLQYDPLEPTQIMAGVGNYRGETAGALGVAHYTNEDTMFHIGATIGNDNNMINAGVTHKFGSSAEKKYIPDRYKAGPISSVYVMQTEVSNLQQENAQQKHVISDQQARLDAMETENARQKQQLDAQQKSIEELKAAVDALLARG